MPCLHCQAPSVGLANKPNSVPNQWAWVMASGWSPKPSLKDISNQEGLGALIVCHLLQHYSISIIKTHIPNQQAFQHLLSDGRCPYLAHIQYIRSEAGHHTKAKDQGQRQWELWAAPPQSPLLSSDHGFERDRSSASTSSSSVASMSEGLGGSRHPHHGWWPHREHRGHTKINLPVFKDEDTKDAITYKSWHWDLTVYHCAGCHDHTLLPYIICSFQGYPGELVRSLETDIMLDDILTILDEHYNNVKALDALNQELFQLHMVDKETVSDWGVCLSRQLQILTASFSEHFLWTT